MVKHIIIGFWKKGSNANATTQVVDFPATRSGLMEYMTRMEKAHMIDGIEGYILKPSTGEIVARFTWSDTHGHRNWKVNYPR